MIKLCGNCDRFVKTLYNTFLNISQIYHNCVKIKLQICSIMKWNILYRCILNRLGGVL